MCTQARSMAAIDASRIRSTSAPVASAWWTGTFMVVLIGAPLRGRDGEARERASRLRLALRTRPRPRCRPGIPLAHAEGAGARHPARGGRRSDAGAALVVA